MISDNAGMNGQSDDRVSLLLVDDRQENLLALEAILEPLGQNLVRANSGPEALRHVLAHEFAAILLDVSPGPLWLGFVPLIGATSLALGGGCLLAVSIAGASPARTLLLPVVLLPLAVPTLVAGIESSTALLAAAPGPAAAWLGVALLEAALFAGLGLLGFEALAAPE